MVNVSVVFLCRGVMKARLCGFDARESNGNVKESPSSGVAETGAVVRRETTAPAAAIEPKGHND